MKTFPKSYVIELCRHLGISTQQEWEDYILPLADYNLPYPVKPEKAYDNFSWDGLHTFPTNERSRLSYNHSAALARFMGIESQRSWAEFVRSIAQPCKIPVPHNAPAYYKARDKWPGWGTFLGTNNYTTRERHDLFVSYEDAKKMLRTLQIKTAESYRDLVSSGLTGDSLPTNPNVSYKDDWESWTKFLAPKYVSYEEAQKILKLNGITSRTQFQENRPDSIPSAPFTYYKDKWVSWPEFLRPWEKKKDTTKAG